MATLTTSPNGCFFRAESPPGKPWYAPERRLRSKTASALALRIVDWIRTGTGLAQEPDETTLFIALHTCAYRACHPTPGAVDAAQERATWTDRWNLVRGHLVERNLGLARSMVARFQSGIVDDDDALSEALYALTRAVDRFQPCKGFRFSTYACNVIARALMRRNKRESRYRRLFPVQHEPSLERPERQADPQTELYVERLKRVLERNLGQLTALESLILAERFAGGAERRMTLLEVAERIGLSKERVRQIESAALGKLRKALKRDPLLC